MRKPSLAKKQTLSRQENARDHFPEIPEESRTENLRPAVRHALVAARQPGKRRTRFETGVFTLTDPKKIAASLKRSAQHSARRKTGAYRSALSMLTFHINRACRTLPKAQRDRLQRAKVELKHQFGKD